MEPKIGIDILELARLDLTPNFLQKILTIQEIQQYEKLENNRRKQEFCAGRWAVKEAIYKVLKSEERIPFSKIEIGYQEERPIILSPNEWQSFAISISHEKKYCVAVALRWK